jgi:tetratricopeptide (TPR) repeat protein
MKRTLIGGWWLALTVTGFAQVDAQFAAGLWKDPAFVNAFMGSYAPATDIEPRINAEEQKLLKEVFDQIQSNPSAALAKVKAALKEDSSAALDFTIGGIHVQLGDYPSAADSYRKAIKKYPSFRRAHKNLGIIAVQLGNYADAITHFTKTLELGGEDGNTYGLSGFCYLNQEKYLSAEIAYRKALLFAPDNLDWKLGLARCLVQQQRSREAVALLEELIQKDSEKADYWLLQANGFLELGEYTKAANNYEILKRMNKATGASLMALGDIYLSNEMKELALEAYLAALDKAPDQELKRPLTALEVLTSRQAWPQAAALLKRIQEVYRTRLTDADRLKLLRHEAQIKLATGETKEAVRALEEVITRDPLDGDAILLLAGHYARAEDFERAALYFERAQNLRDFEASACIQHAQMLVAQSKYDKAVKLLQRAQTIRPRENVGRYLDQVERLARAARL